MAATIQSTCGQLVKIVSSIQAPILWIREYLLHSPDGAELQWVGFNSSRSVCLLSRKLHQRPAWPWLSHDYVTLCTPLTYLGLSFLKHKVRILIPVLSPSCDMDIKSIWKTIKQGAKIVVIISGIICAAWILHEEDLSSNWQTITALMLNMISCANFCWS